MLSKPKPKEYKTLLKENFNQYIFSYLNSKDLSSASQVCKKFNRTAEKSNSTYKADCESFFCGLYENTR